MIFWPWSKVLNAFYIYLIRSIIVLNHINDFLNSYNAFFTLPKAIPTRPGGQNIVRYFDPQSRYFHPQCIDDKVFFAFHIYLIRSLYWDHINDFLNSYNAFILTLPKAIPHWPGVKISYDILTPYLDIFRFHPQWINDKGFLHFILLDKIIILKSYQWFLA